jgi:phosphate-selective porin OprO/OprP
MKLKNLLFASATFATMIAGSAFAQETQIDWSKGSPRFTSDDGRFQFRVRGRYMLDAYAYDADFAGTSNDFSDSGFASRRARIGVEGKFDSVWNFKAEYTLKGTGNEYNDVWISYDNNGLEFLAGNNYFTSNMDGLTSSVVHLTSERGLATNAFGQADRNLGFLVRKYSDNWFIVAGYYGDKGENAETAGTTASNFTQIRGNYAISNEKGKYLVVGASARLRDSNESGTYSYNPKPAQSNYAAGYFNSPSALKDTTIGLEGFMTYGSLSVLADYQFVKTDTKLSQSLPIKHFDLSGGMIEVAYMFTGETRGYDAKTGEVKGFKPISTLEEGGYGAWGVVARYDRLDLGDYVNGTTKGTVADGYTIGAVWQPTDLVLFRADFARTDYKNGSKGDGTVDVFNLRTQFNF